MVDKCFGERKEELAAVWARDTLGLEERDYRKLDDPGTAFFYHPNT